MKRRDLSAKSAKTPAGAGGLAWHKRGIEGLHLLGTIVIMLALIALLLYFYHNSFYEKGLKPMMDRLFRGFGDL